MSKPLQNAKPAPMVIAVIAVVLGQAVALIVNAILTALDPDSDALPATAKFFLVFLFLLAAVWLIGAARGVYQGKAWPRGALIVAEVLAVIVSFTYFQLGDYPVALALVLTGGFVLVGLFTPALNQHLTERRSRTDD